MENESAPLSDFHQACTISEHPIESCQLEREGWAKLRILIVDIYQLTGVMNADDSAAPWKYETFSLNQGLLVFIVGSKEDQFCGMLIIREKGTMG